MSELHPGSMLSEYLKFNNWSYRELADRTGLPMQVIIAVCNEQSPVTPEIALVLEKAFDRPASFWLNMQAWHDLEAARGL